MSNSKHLKALNIGLINNLSSYGHLNKYGFVQTPYRKVDRETGVVTNEIVWLTADEEDEFTVAQANSRLNEDGTFAEKVVMGRHQGVNQEYPAEVVDYMDVSPKQVVAVATACIPSWKTMLQPCSPWVPTCNVRLCL